jgi:hypothetical protein
VCGLGRRGVSLPWQTYPVRLREGVNGGAWHRAHARGSSVERPQRLGRSCRHGYRGRMEGSSGVMVDWGSWPRPLKTPFRLVISSQVDVPVRSSENLYA